MSWAQLFVGIALASAVGVLYPKRAPGDRFKPNRGQRRLALVLLALSVGAQLLLCLSAAQPDAALVGGLGSMALGGLWVCAATPKGPWLVLAMGLLGLILTGVSWALGG